MKIKTHYRCDVCGREIPRRGINKFYKIKARNGNGEREMLADFDVCETCFIKIIRELQRTT